MRGAHVAQSGPEYVFLSAQLEPWAGGYPRRGRHSLMAELAQRHQVFWITPPYYLREALGLAPRHPLRPTESGCTQVTRTLCTVAPPRWLPGSLRFKRLDAMLAQVRHGWIRRKVRQPAHRHTVLYLWHPAMTPLVDAFPAATVVYHKYDEYAQLLPETQALETRLLDRADRFLVVSDTLADSHRARRPDVAIVRNGVDTAPFHAVRAGRVSIPEDLARIGPPRLGYAGVLNGKVDYDAMEEVARARPDCSVVLIGPDRAVLPEDRARLDRLMSRPNCHHLGWKPASLVPAYLAHLDACLLANLVTPYTRFTQPLKLYEYLASGRPVVSSGLPAVAPHRALIEIADSPEDWVRAVEAGLRNDSPAAAAQRIATAEENSWWRRAQQVERILAEAPRRGSGGTH